MTVTVEVGVGVSVGVAVKVAVIVGVAVGDSVGVAVAVPVGEGVALGSSVGVAVAVPVGVAVGVRVKVGVGVGVPVGVAPAAVTDLMDRSSTYVTPESLGKRIWSLTEAVPAGGTTVLLKPVQPPVTTVAEASWNVWRVPPLAWRAISSTMTR